MSLQLFGIMMADRAARAAQTILMVVFCTFKQLDWYFERNEKNYAGLGRNMLFFGGVLYKLDAVADAGLRR